MDEGALNENVTSTSAIPDWARQEWSEVKRDRKGGSEVSLSQRRIPLPNLLLDYGYDTKTGFFPKEITNVGALKKGLQLYGYDLITNRDERTGEITGYHIAVVTSMSDDFLVLLLVVLSVLALVSTSFLISCITLSFILKF